MKKMAFKQVSEDRVNFDEMIIEILTFANLPQTVTVEAANISVRLKCETSQQVHLIKERYKDFLTDKTEVGLEVGVWVKELPFFITPPSAPEEFVIEVTHENDRISVLSYSFAGYFDVQRRSGKLVIIAPHLSVGEADEDGFLGSIENYLRVAYSWLCIEKSGFLLHACGIIRKGKAYVFFGPSESGKTTVAMLSRNLSILSDDLVIVLRINPPCPFSKAEGGKRKEASPHRGDKRGAEGISLLLPTSDFPLSTSEGETRAFGVPFRGSAPFLFANKNENAPIAGFFELQKSSFFRLEKLSRPLAVAKLVSNIPFLGEKLMLSGKPLAVCSNAITDVPCYTMYFTKDDSFWQELNW